MAKSEKKHINLIQTAEAIVEGMFPAGTAGKGPGAGSGPEGKSLKVGKGKRGAALTVKGPGAAKAKRKQGGGGKAGTRDTARISR